MLNSGIEIDTKAAHSDKSYTAYYKVKEQYADQLYTHMYAINASKNRKYFTMECNSGLKHQLGDTCFQLHMMKALAQLQRYYKG